MTVNDLVDKLQNLQTLNHGEDIVKCYDPDAEGYMPVTGFTYGFESPIMLYTDEQ